jgi:hypothetical protein
VAQFDSIPAQNPVCILLFNLLLLLVVVLVVMLFALLLLLLLPVYQLQLCQLLRQVDTL